MATRAWSSDDVEHALRQTALTMSRMPGGQVERWQKLRAWWPEVAPDRRTDYPRDSRRPRIPATQADIQRCDVMLELVWDWLTPERLTAVTLPHGGALPDDMVRIVWWRAFGRPWSKIFEERRARHGKHPAGGNTKQSIIPKYRAVLAFLAAAWTQEGVDPQHPELHRRRQTRR